MLLVFGAEILALFDPSYAEAWPALAVFAAGFFVNTLGGPCGYVMAMTGAERRYLRWALLAHGAGVVGSGMCAAAGMVWAALAMAVAGIVVNLVCAAWVRRELGLETTVLCLLPAWRRPGPGAPPRGIGGGPWAQV